MCSLRNGNWGALAFVPIALLPTDSPAQVSRDGRSYTLDASKLDTGVTGTWKFTAIRE